MDNISKKILLSAGIGLGVAASGLSLYLLFRPEVEFLNISKDEKKIKETNNTVLTIRVPKQYVGAVIGRGGENVHKIQKETKTRIHFDDTGARKLGLTDLADRFLAIKGPPECTAKAEQLIARIIDEQSRITTKHFSVDTNAIGGIIGRNGETIRYCRQLDSNLSND